MAKVELRNLHKAFGEIQVIKGIDLVVDDCELCVFVGPSGCGKSTLLRIIAGLEEPDSGDVLIRDRNVTALEPVERGIAMVFQNYALYPHLTVRENIGFGLSLTRLPKTEIAKQVEAAAETLQLTPYLNRKPKALSDGQRQRVAIGRSIVRNPEVFLFDEPLSNLDASLRGQMRIELTDLHLKLKTTMIYVTHDQVEAMSMADKIVVINGGAVEQIGSPMELYDKPATPFVAGFIGSPQMNLYTGDVARKMGCITYGIRPEHIMIDAAGIWQGTVRHIERLGADTILHLYVEQLGSLLVRTPGAIDYHIGQSLQATPLPDRQHRF